MKAWFVRLLERLGILATDEDYVWADDMLAYYAWADEMLDHYNDHANLYRSGYRLVCKVEGCHWNEAHE